MTTSTVGSHVGLRLAAVYASGMVLQRDVPLPVRGFAAAGAGVRGTLAGHTAAATAGRDGGFVLRFPPLPAGGPHTLTVELSGGGAVELTDILVGDVWLCSGQSNMEWTVDLSNDADRELADAAVDGLRLFHLDRELAYEPLPDVRRTASGGPLWRHADAASAKDFSAVGFFFARKIRREAGVPVGMISTCWGGTQAEAWTPLPAIKAEPALAPIAGRYGGVPEKKEPIGPHVDPGISPEAAGWAKVELPEPEAWGQMAIPCSWQSRGLNHNGVVWFRREVILPDDFDATGPAVLSLGVCDDCDHTFVNGTLIGSVHTDTPNFWAVRRSYDLPPGLLRPGRNVIAVRVFDQWGGGGICGIDTDLYLDAGRRRTSLVGDWAYRVELAMELRYPGSDEPIQPSTIYNAMVHPLLPFPIRGALWYQGESNADRAEQYRTLLPTMIRAWREAWGNAFPFYIVQLAAWRAAPTHPGDSDWAELREAQFLTTRALPDVHVISAIDVGDPEDIHPKDKQTVANRLADAALGTAYGRDTPWQHPTLKLATFRPDGSVRVELNHARGLHNRTDRIDGFCVSDEAGSWHWATASFETDPSPSAAPALIVRSDAVSKPTALRYNWSDNPPCTLFNGQGLPPLPFRTDDRPYITAGRG